MNNTILERQRKVNRYLLIHFAIVLILPFFLNVFSGLWDYVVLFIATGVVLAFFDRRYGQYLFWCAAFIVYMVKEIIFSNLALAWLIIQPKMKIDPGIVGIPLTVTTNMEIIVLSLAIAATPGTLVVDLGKNADGEYVLYVHTINVGNPEDFRALIKNGFERMVLRISQGATQ